MPSDALTLDQRREAEAEKYRTLYAKAESRSDVTGRSKAYGMMAPNRGARLLHELNTAWAAGCRTLLDVGCGKGWLLDEARGRGWTRLHGIDCAPRVHPLARPGYAHDIQAPTGSYDFVVCSDVMEHILEEDVPLVLSELRRVARMRVHLTISHRESSRDGMNLHITMKPLDWWKPRLAEAFGKYTYNHHPGKAGTEVTWTA